MRSVRAAMTLIVAAMPWSMAGRAADGDDGGWGEATNGLQARVIAVAPDTEEQRPTLDAAVRVDSFRRPNDVTLLCELRNVGETPIELRGIRYGDSVSRGAGDSASDHFAPYLFRCEFFDAAGTAVLGPANAIHPTDAWLTLGSGLSETLPPGESLTVLLKPAQWDASVTRLLRAGRTTVRIHYCGPPRGALEFERSRPELRERFGADIWTGDVAAADLIFNIERDGVVPLAGPQWGPAENGLRAAVELRNAAPTGRAIVDTASSTFSYGSRIEVRFLVENVSDRTITFWSEDWRQSDARTIVDGKGKELSANGRGAFYTGWDILRRWSLKPGQLAVLRAIDFGVARDEAGAAALEHPIARTTFTAPGEYGVRYDVRFNGWRRGKPGSKDAIPGKDDWQGTLTTGVAPFHVR